MTEDEVARFDLVLREADRIRQEIAFEEAFYAWSEGSQNGTVYGLEHSQESVPLLAA